ncbi:hypothetical protein [Bdellovibrio sp. NC01]|uniref:hypothetical protein n=1 Tax=Bdellovibrio sp. NC01 TaxID=2220073 RepID=UPI001FEDFB4D|nr:hypothetical protein [Bdellovibrio sp. NC01]
MNSFFELDARVAVTQDDLNFAQSVILKDQWRPFQMDASCMAKIEYNRASFTQKLAVDFGLPDNNNNLDLYNIDGTSAERWEFLYRAKISSALIQNFYVFPNGFRAIESYHPNISLNPDAPISECYVQDVTSRHELEQWLQKNVSSKTFVY